MKKISILLFSMALITACSSNQPEEIKEVKTEVIVRGEAQGTTYTIKYIAEEYEEGIKEEIDSVLADIDQSMSTYVPSSTISDLNNGDTVLLDEHFIAVYALSQEFNQRTNGAFDPTIGPLIKAWGFDYADPQRMDSLKIKSLLLNCGFGNFILEGNILYKQNPGASINFNAIAQGYSVDLMASVLDSKKIKNYYVELGGELVVKGSNKFQEDWIIGIDKPLDENVERSLAATIQITDRGIATSGNYRKFYEVDGQRYSHTLNPETGYPAMNSLLSATVVAGTAAEADAMATAFMVMGTEKSKKYLEKHTEVEAFLIYATTDTINEFYISSGLKDKFSEN